MDNIWAFLEQTLTATVAAVLLLVTKRLFLDKLSPRWQYGVWAILALRVLLPAGLLGRALLPGGQVVLEAAKAWVERGLSSALTDPYGITQVTAPIPLVRLVGPNSVTDLLFLLYAAGVAALLLWFGLAYLALRRRVARGGTPSPAVLCDSPVYYAMVAPEGDRQQAQQQATQPFEEADLYSSPFWELGFTWSRPAWQAEWSVMNLMADGTGGYTGTLFFIPLNGHDTMGVVVQQVAVRPEGMFWTVERLGKLESWVRDDLWLCPSSKAPYTTYVAETAGLRVEMDFQCRLWVEHQKVQDEGMFQLYSGGVDFTPNPHGIFTEVCTGIGARVCSTETGDTLDLTLKAALMGETGDPAQALKESRYCFTLSTGGLDDDVVQVSTGTYSGDGMSLTAMPAALAVQFAYEGQTHTCVALPEEVSP